MKNKLRLFWIMGHNSFTNASWVLEMRDGTIRYSYDKLSGRIVLNTILQYGLYGPEALEMLLVIHNIIVICLTQNIKEQEGCLVQKPVLATNPVVLLLDQKMIAL